MVGCGSAVLAAAFPDTGIGLIGVSFAFGLTVLTMAFAIGHISGCHLNQAVTIGLWTDGRFDAKDVVPYIIAQVLGGIIAGGVNNNRGIAGINPRAAILAISFLNSDSLFLVSLKNFILRLNHDLCLIIYSNISLISMHLLLLSDALSILR